MIRQAVRYINTRCRTSASHYALIMWLFIEKKNVLTCVRSQLYTTTRIKVFFNFILKQHWLPIAVR